MPDDDFDELARHLRQGDAGREVRAEAEENESLTELQRRRHQDLADVARAAMHRGDKLTLVVGGLTLAHPVAAVGADYLTMETGDGTIDVRLDAAVLTIEPRTSGGKSARPGSTTFRARLAEHEAGGAWLEVVTSDGQRIAGRIVVAATDHIALTDDSGAVSCVPVAATTVIFSRIPPRRS